MNRYKIEGGNKLKGSINIHGAKNAALPILAATVINSGKSVIHNRHSRYLYRAGSC